MDELQAEERFQRLNRLANDLLDVSVSFVGFLTSGERRFHHSLVLDVGATAHVDVFIDYTLRQDDIFSISDAANDARFSAESLVAASPFIRFFAGIPLLSKNGTAFGAFCVMDPEPRILRAWERRAFKELAFIAEDMHTLSALEFSAC